jgi:ubiquinone/menaquinone biosynthesis C-methylase UbiE
MISASESKIVTAHAYDGWARIWNGSCLLNRPIYRAALKALPQEMDSVLDVGCGTGVMAKKLARRGAKVTGVDISGEMISKARRPGLPGATFHLGDAEALGDIPSASS